MRPLVSIFTFLTLSLSLAPTLMAGGPNPSAGLPASAEMLWVTMGEDLFDTLRQQHSLLSTLQPPQALDSDAGVVITQLSSKDLERVSGLAHKVYHRCGGFIVHGDLGEARRALQSVRANRNLTAPASFSLNQGALVQSLLPNLVESNILDTFTHLSTQYSNRYYTNPSGEASALWIRDLWQGYAAGRTDVTVETYNHSGYNQPSVILTIQGNSLASEVVVFGAHLDSTLSGGSNGPSSTSPGADDDASGIASLSEVIRVLLSNGFTPDRTVKFMGYAAEEVGLRGSGDIAQDHVDNNINVVGMMQLDMTAFNGSVEDITFISDFTNADLTNFAGSLITTYLPGVSYTTDTCGYGCSDHASWHNRGFPAVMPFEANFGQHNQAIHTPNDTVATLNNSAAHAIKFARLALAFAVETGMADCTPAAQADAGPDQNINEGSSVQIGTAAQSGHTYSWSPGGGSGAQIAVSPTTTTTYTVTATTSCGSAQDSVTVNVTPTGSNGPQDAVFNSALGVPACAVAGSECDSLTLLDGRAGLGPESNQPNTLDGCADGTSGSYHSDESSDRVVVSTLDGGNFSVGDTVTVTATVYAYQTGSSDTLDLYYAADANSPSWVYITSLSPSGGGAQTLSANYTLPSGNLQAVRARFRYQGSANACNNGQYDDADDLVFAVEGGAANAPPSVNISSPSNGASFDEGTSVSFGGSASDTEDGDLSASLSWSSNLDGNIGSGASFSTSGLSAGSHTITASGTDSGGLSGSDQVSITVNTVGGGCSGCIDFNTVTTVSYSNQDNSANATVVDGGDGLLLTDNTWRRTTQTYTITANTLLEVTFESTVQGEIHGIGFDEDDTLTNNTRIFQFHGTQAWGSAFQTYNNYTSGEVTYTIPVGASYTGSAMHLVLVNDNDAGAGNTSRFTNVRIYEDAPPPPSSCAAEVDFDSGAAGWVAAASSTCSTGAFIAGTPTQQTNGGTTTQVGGDHTSGSGQAFYTAANSSAGNVDVDGGNCIAESPVYPVNEASDVSIWYFHGQRDAGDDSGDFFRLEISTDGGATYADLVNLGDVNSNAVWTEAATTVAAGTNVQFRVQVSDGTGGGDLVEGGVDDLAICPTP